MTNRNRLSAVALGACLGFVVFYLGASVLALQEPTPTLVPTASAELEPSSTPAPPVVIPTDAPIPTPTPGLQFEYYKDWALPHLGLPWRPYCKDKGRTNGFTIGWMNGFCVPGVITKDSQYFPSPVDHYGLMSSYGPNVMEANVAHRGLNPREVQGVALMSCADIGKTVWLRLPGRPWKGPFVVVDCSGRNHLYYHMVAMGLAVEIGYETAREWGVDRADRIDVHIGSRPPVQWDGVFLPVWWVENVLKFEPMLLADPEEEQ